VGGVCHLSELADLRGQGKNTNVAPGVIEGTIFVQFVP
jgi:hypothetical protein